MQVSIECQKRPEKSNPNTLRRTGFIPAVLYGHNGTESVSLVIKEKEALTMLKKASINNTLVDVSVPEMPWTGKALLKEVQSHPWKNSVYHISFFSVASHGKLDIVVPLRMVGEALGLKQGGMLEQSVMDINVECLAESIPEEIEVDITNLEVGQSLTLGDLNMPEGVVLKGDKNVTVIAIVASKK